jgi:hypothetical protein
MDPKQQVTGQWGSRAFSCPEADVNGRVAEPARPIHGFRKKQRESQPLSAPAAIPRTIWR